MGGFRRADWLPVAVADQCGAGERKRPHGHLERGLALRRASGGRETLEGAAKWSSEGDHTNLLAAVGAAVLFGWLVSGRTFSCASRGTDDRSGTMEQAEE